RGREQHPAVPAAARRLSRRRPVLAVLALGRRLRHAAAGRDDAPRRQDGRDRQALVSRARARGPRGSGGRRERALRLDSAAGMRRLALIALASALLLAGCGSGETVGPLPETVVGQVQTTGPKGNAAAGKPLFTSNG